MKDVHYVRAFVPGDPARSTWVPVEEATPEQRRDEPSTLAHWLIVIGIWLMLSAGVILGALYFAEWVEQDSAVTHDVQMPKPTPYPGGWNYGKP